MMTLVCLVLLVAPAARAGEVEIVAAEATRSGQGWTFSVTLRHDDTGWDHYADAWRVVGPDGAVLGERILLHPHETEQPFTRSLSGVAIPEDVGAVMIEARDNVHGWAAQTFRVDLKP